jgi:murein DD-endopeptidase MepM/ murein hydrolase activator NlpD
MTEESDLPPHDLPAAESSGSGVTRRGMISIAAILAGLSAVDALGIFGTIAPAHAAVAWAHPFSERTKLGDYWQKIRTYGTSPHQGVDYQPIGAAPFVIAPAAGTVTGTPSGGGGGYMVAVNFGTQPDGATYRMEFLHMVAGSVEVSAGQTVARGQRLGRMGATGAANGVHTHINMWQNGTQIDSWPHLGGAPLSTEPIPSPTYQEGDDTMLIRNSARGDFFASPGIVKKSPNPNVFNMLAAGGIPIVTIVDSNIDAVLMAFAGPNYTYADDLYVNPRLLTPGT